MEPGVLWESLPEEQAEAWHGGGSATLRQMVFGMNDGLVATVGLVAGLIFAGSSRGVVLGSSLAAIIAAAVSSMVLGSYLSTRVEVGYHEVQVRREQRAIAEPPHEELQEMRRLYQSCGMSDLEVAMIRSHLQRDKTLWLRLMLRDELGIVPESFESPWRNAGLMALAVAAGSLPPVLPVIFGQNPRHALVWVVMFSVLTALGLGSATARSTGRRWWRSAISFLAVASIAAAIGMGAGSLIAPLFA
ncbi:VIT1/CCC1 transporter family protein [Sulfobacillus harzensis]|uniref:VIT family protein n=1 Tax=Sulfobacillus harzensis TaxID=2729629 RepID=A0A7Y0L4E0_9FIRM|nr:VIT1/CCC1 transporter family protein [Sulfobacillus harzensis]NMP22873.1 hypothetical protein [Sulfobacillus harzensis]